MHFLSTQNVVSDLVEDRISNKNAAEYYFANTIFLTFWSYYSLYFGLASRGLLFFAECGAVMLATILGITACYQANGGSSGRDFVLRATCLSFPIMVKVYTVSALLGWANFYLFYKVFDESSFRSSERILNVVMFLWAPVFAFIFFWCLSVHLRTVTHRSVPNLVLNN